MVRCVLGLVLLGAGVAKGYEATTEFHVVSLVESAARLGLVAFELALGLWLLSGKRLKAAWVVSRVCFAAFLFVSLAQLSAGARSCGCFGKVPISPSYVAAFDFVALIGLVACSPTTRTNGPGLRFFAPYLVGAGAMLSAVAVWGYIQFGSLPIALAYLQGSRMIVDPATLPVGAGRAGEQQQVEVRVANLTDSPIRLLGASSSCGCTLIEGQLPCVIPCQEVKSLALRVTFVAGLERDFTHRIQLYSDSGAPGALEVRVSGRVHD